VEKLKYILFTAEEFNFLFQKWKMAKKTLDYAVEGDVHLLIDKLRLFNNRLYFSFVDIAL